MHEAVGFAGKRKVADRKGSNRNQKQKSAGWGVRIAVVILGILKRGLRWMQRWCMLWNGGLIRLFRSYLHFFVARAGACTVNESEMAEANVMRHRLDR